MSVIERVVVTGAGAGIGAALAARWSARGAQVVVADRDADSVRRVAEELGAHAVVADVASADGVESLVHEAREVLGGVDTFFANAGTARDGGPECSDESWDQSWTVNVMAHVWASRLLVPEWVEAGSGRFVATISAAGLLTSLEAAPYAVSKHAALGFAEWLSATYRHRGIRVHAVCPQGVQTAMLEQASQGGQMIMRASAISADDVVDAVVDGIAAERFLILPHPEVHRFYQQRAADTDSWLQGMNRLQQRIEALSSAG